MVLSQANKGITEDIRIIANDFTAPVMDVLSRPFVTASESIDGFTNIRTLKAENIRLAEENIKLHQWYEAALRLEAENKSLRGFLNLKIDPDYHYYTTRIISDAGGSYVKSFLVPLGKKDGIRKGQAVLSERGLIGRVTEAGKQSARILMITDLNSRIPVKVQTSNHKAILSGQNTDIMRLERLPLDSGVEVGTHILTSGQGGVLPPDIPVGIISKVDETGVYVSLLTNIDKLIHVKIVDAGYTLLVED